MILENEHRRFYDRLRAKIEDFIHKQGQGRIDGATQYILLAPDLFVLFARLMQDRRVPAKTKAIAGAVVAYFISPLDIIPELVFGPLGYLDDIVLAVYALNRILQQVDRSIILEHWNGEENLFDVVREVLMKAEDLVGRRVFAAIKRRFKR
ncbi:hypothetical protein BEP19_00410 [Ammoniphilus oxalaticus]|uniref:DUF1232 domain-containing protein n=1 Tax=Ammoniphilus oxalaticus TaxID=66863 RepID=A0A419SRI7_9BACL|nr:hypothetical protein BEP19_00410 [Ammoniphilus oxalaticus]